MEGTKVIVLLSITFQLLFINLRLGDIADAIQACVP